MFLSAYILGVLKPKYARITVPTAEIMSTYSGLACGRDPKTRAESSQIATIDTEIQAYFTV